MKALLALKEQYQAATGTVWQPQSAKPSGQSKAVGADTSSTPSGSNGKQVEELLGKIEAQGNKVRQLKDSGASKVRKPVVWFLNNRERYFRHSV